MISKGCRRVGGRGASASPDGALVQPLAEGGLAFVARIRRRVLGLGRGEMGDRERRGGKRDGRFSRLKADLRPLSSTFRISRR